MESIIIETILIIGVIFFIYWQFVVMKKYVLKFDSFKMDVKKRCLILKKENIKFRDIDYISVEELEQPSMLEKTLTKSGAYCYMSKIIFYMKDGTIKDCTFNYKGALYKALKDIKPYVKTECDIEKYKPNSIIGALLLIVLLSCSVIVFVSLIRSL